MSEEGTQEPLVVLERSCVGAGGRGHVAELEERDVGQGMELEEAPEVLDRVELGSVGREKLDMESWGAAEEAANLLRTMGLEAIPDHDERPGYMTVEDAKKLHDFGRPNVAPGVQTKVQLDAIPGRRNGQRRLDGDFLARSGPLQKYRRLAAWRPAAAHQWGHQEAAFVEEDEARVESTGFFLMRGQSAYSARIRPLNPLEGGQ